MLLPAQSVPFKAMLLLSKQPYFNPASENGATKKVRNKQLLSSSLVGSSHSFQRSHAVTLEVLVYAGGGGLY